MSSQRPRASSHLGHVRPSYLGVVPWGEAFCWALMLHLGVVSWWGTEQDSLKSPQAAAVRSTAAREVHQVRFMPRSLARPPTRRAPSEAALELELSPIAPEPQLTELASSPEEPLPMAALPAPASLEPLSRVNAWSDWARRSTAHAEPLPLEPVEEHVVESVQQGVALQELPPVEAPLPTTSAPFALAENLPPRYPALALRRGWEGRVVLQVSVGLDGSVAELEILESSGVPLLDATARKAVASWRFEPARRDGRAELGVATVGLRFELKERAVKTAAGS